MVAIKYGSLPLSISPRYMLAMPNDPVNISPSNIKEGDILIGHGLLANPALLLDRQIPLDEGCLLDFCTLINALATIV